MVEKNGDDRLCSRHAYRRVIVAHALRNALIPAVTAVGASTGALLGGAVVTETIFRLPGMGQLVVDSQLYDLTGSIRLAELDVTLTYYSRAAATENVRVTVGRR